METVTKYVARDGKEFLSKSDCIIHEDNLDEIDVIMSKLPTHNTSCEFQNGNGFVQHDLDVMLSVRNEFLYFVIERYGDEKWFRETIDGGLDIDPSWAGRIMSEMTPSYVYSKWNRFSCIDKLGREFGQIYFVTHPDEAELFCINKKGS